MKKYLVLFIVVLLLVVGCGKDKSGVKTLTCKMEDDDYKESFTIEQDMKTNKFKKVTMVVSIPKEMYDELELSDDELKKEICSDAEGEYNTCDVVIENGILTASYDLKPEEQEKDILEEEEYNIKKIDENTLDILKESAEKDGRICTIK